MTEPTNTSGKSKKGRKKLILAEPVVRTKLLENLGFGASNRYACNAAGMSESTFYDYLWMAENIVTKEKPERIPRYKEDRALYLEFSEAVKRARAEGRVNNLVIINNAALGGEKGKPDWYAAAWLLERSDPENYGRRVIDNRISGPNGGAIPVQVQNALPLMPKLLKLLEQHGISLEDYIAAATAELEDTGGNERRQEGA